jgi:hypothetical protein
VKSLGCGRGECHLRQLDGTFASTPRRYEKCGFTMRKPEHINHQHDQDVRPYFKKAIEESLNAMSKKNREGRREALCDITEKFNLNVCIDTLAKEFNKLGLSHRIARKKPYISERQCINRLKFAKDCEAFGFEEWSRVIFSDEMGIQTGSNDRKVWVWR